MTQMSEKQIILSIALSGLVLSGASFGGVYWAEGKITEEQQAIEGIKGKIQQAQAKKRRIPQDEKDVIILRENVGEYVKILPNSGDLTNYARVVDSFRTRSGVNLSQFLQQNVGGQGKGAFSRYVYTVTIEATLWQFMKFMNLFESHKRFVAITSYSLTAGKPDPDNPFDPVRHQISMVIETYVYNQAAGGKKPVPISQYNSKRDILREEIYLARKNIKVLKYSFTGEKHRRDIFIDPRFEEGAEGTSVENPREIQRRIEELGNEISALMTRYEKAKNEEIMIERYAEFSEIKKVYAKLRTKAEELKELQTLDRHSLIYNNKIVMPLENLAAALDKNRDSADSWTLAQLQSNLGKMQDMLVDGDLIGAKTLYETMRDAGLEFKDERGKVAEIMHVLYEKALAALEFKSLTLEMRGVILLPKGISIAIINGKTYQEGDAINNDLYLKEVRKEYVVFLYKGVEIAKRR